MERIYYDFLIRANRRGVTLIELMMVVSIISFMLVITVGAYESVSQKSEVIVCGNRLKQVGKVLHSYANDYHNHFPTAIPPLGFGSLYNWGDLWAAQDPNQKYFSTQVDRADPRLLLGNKTEASRLPRFLEYYTGSVTTLHCPGRGFSQSWPQIGPYYYNVTSPWGNTMSAEGIKYFNYGIWEPVVKPWQSGTKTAIAACQNPEYATRNGWEWRHGGQKDNNNKSLNNHLYIDGSVKGFIKPKLWTRDTP